MPIQLGTCRIYTETCRCLVHCTSLNWAIVDYGNIVEADDTAGDMELVELDVTGLNCPMPLLKAQKALNEMQPKQQLRLVATDPARSGDFEVFARQSGHLLLESTVPTDVTPTCCRRRVEPYAHEIFRHHQSVGEPLFFAPDAIYLVAVLVIAMALLMAFGGALAPVLTGLVIAFLLQGIVGSLEHRRVPRWVAVYLAFLLFCNGHWHRHP